jgi:hypothetical protein
MFIFFGLSRFRTEAQKKESQIWLYSVHWGREYLRGKYHCTIDLLFDLFGLACFANKNKKIVSYHTTDSKPVKQEVNGTVSPYSIPWLGWWSVAYRSLGGKLQCGGLRPLYEGLERSGSFVEEGTACRSAFWFVFGGDGVDGRHYWWPCGLFLDFQDFSMRRKILENCLPQGRDGNSLNKCYT